MILRLLSLPRLLSFPPPALLKRYEGDVNLLHNHAKEFLQSPALGFDPRAATLQTIRMHLETKPAGRSGLLELPCPAGSAFLGLGRFSLHSLHNFHTMNLKRITPFNDSEVMELIIASLQFVSSRLKLDNERVQRAAQSGDKAGVIFRGRAGVVLRWDAAAAVGQEVRVRPPSPPKPGKRYEARLTLPADGYLMRFATPVEVWFAISDRKLEEDWVELLVHEPRFACPTPRFGSSDYRRSRTSHLFFSKRRPSFNQFEQRVRSVFEPTVRPQRAVLAGGKAEPIGRSTSISPWSVRSAQ